ncbi:C40 family peptidase [Couchioplanes caeruleus]|uniref:C40 family peptidase n=1 Tax=Couchioplanes caeruleus TaxID=56438 RepID=UPI001FD4DF21|nr:NlpC/P60 family protein [Couchioplanes caeruleus]
MLAAGALALAVSTPALEPAAPAEAQIPLNPIAAVTPFLEARNGYRAASRTAARRSVTRPAAASVHGQIPTVRADEEPRPLAEVTMGIAQRMAEAERRLAAQRAVRSAAQRAVQRATAQRAATRRAQRAAALRAQRSAAQTAKRAAVRPRVTHRAAAVGQRAVGSAARMASVVTFARSQLGKRYARGGEGPHAFDCSGFTKTAYARAGLRLPHSSNGQAARARIVSRAAARPGDLVVGRGHVGVYMGRGMMIDAGNPRTGVVYRKLYAGLHIERF